MGTRTPVLPAVGGGGGGGIINMGTPRIDTRGAGGPDQPGGGGGARELLLLLRVVAVGTEDLLLLLLLVGPLLPLPIIGRPPWEVYRSGRWL